MSALASYLRHLIVTGLMLAITRAGLPLEGASEAVESIALLAIGTLTWAITKYAPQLAKRAGLLLALLFCALCCLVGCSGSPVPAAITLSAPEYGLSLTYVTPGK